MSPLVPAEAYTKALKKGKTLKRARHCFPRGSQQTIITLGLGTLPGNIEGTDLAGRAPMVELVAFEKWINLIETHQKSITLVFLQVPQFNARDQSILIYHAYEVIKTPTSDKFLTKSSFVFTPNACQSVVYASLHKELPALSHALVWHMMAWHFRLYV